MRRTVALLVLLAAVAPLWADEPRDIIDRALKAHGGAENLGQTAATRLTFHGKQPSANLVLAGDWLMQAPRKQKQQFNLTINDQKIDVVTVMVDGKCWQKMSSAGVGQGTMELRGSEIQAIEGYMQEAHVRSLLPLVRDGRFVLATLPESTVEGRPAVGVRASYPNRPEVSLYFDKETYLLVKTTLLVAGVNLDTVYGDYRATGDDEERLLERAGVKTDRASLHAYLVKHQVDPAAVEKARALVKRLADESFEVREKAGNDLVALGVPAIPALQAATKDDDLEVSRRALACLEKIQTRIGPETIRAAVRLLALRFPDGAAEKLLALLPGADETVAEDIRAGLVLLAERPGGADPALVRALEEKDPARREAARAVLGRDGRAYLDQPGRRLLLPGVRVPYRRVMFTGGTEQLELTVTEHQFFNYFADKEFAKP